MDGLIALSLAKKYADKLIDGESTNPQSAVLVIPAGTTVVTPEMVLDRNIEYAVFPNSVTRIDDETFTNCHNLKYIQNTQNVSVVGANAFL